MSELAERVDRVLLQIGRGVAREHGSCVTVESAFWGDGANAERVLLDEALRRINPNTTAIRVNAACWVWVLPK